MTPFALPSLDWGVLLLPGDLTVYPPPAGTSAGSAVWKGTASAGVSANFDAFHDALSDHYLGPNLDGKPTLDFTTTNTNTKKFSICAADTNARAGVAGAVETAVSAGITDGIYTSATGSQIALVELVAISGGQSGIIQGPGSGGPSLQTSTGGGGTVEFGNGGPDFYVSTAAPSLNVWVLVQGRWSGGVYEIRLNNGSWTTRGSAPGFNNTTIAIGQNQYTTEQFYGALFGESPVRFSDGTFDDIYAAVKTLCPSAGLP